MIHTAGRHKAHPNWKAIAFKSFFKDKHKREESNVITYQQRLPNTVIRTCNIRLRNRNMVHNAIIALNSRMPNKPHVDWKFPSAKVTPNGLKI